MTYPKNCPVCGIKNNGEWFYLCLLCWDEFLKYLNKKHPNRTGEAYKFLSEYLDSSFSIRLKEKVQFT